MFIVLAALCVILFVIFNWRLIVASVIALCIVGFFTVPAHAGPYPDYVYVARDGGRNWVEIHTSSPTCKWGPMVIYQVREFHGMTCDVNMTADESHVVFKAEGHTFSVKASAIAPLPRM
jgi:hypothetical protein